MRILCALLLFTTLVACSEKPQAKKHIPDAKAKLLNDSALTLATQSPPKNFEKAIILLDEATKIDTNYYAAFNSKISFQLNLNRDSDALITAKNLLRIKPENPAAHFITGLIFWKLGDTVSANDYFIRSSALTDKSVGKLSKSDKRYNGAMLNKAINLIIIGQEKEGHNILQQLYDNEKDKSDKEIFMHFMHKTKEELLYSFAYSDTSSSESDPIIKY